MDITSTVQVISPFNMFVQVVSTILLLLLALVAIKFLIKFLRFK
jgi:hypothetical protein